MKTKTQEVPASCTATTFLHVPRSLPRCYRRMGHRSRSARLGPLDCDIKQMGLSGASPLGEVKTKAPNSDYHNHRDVPPEVARDYLKRVARIGELNGHPRGSDGPMATALKRHNGGRMLVFVVGALAEMPEDVSRICGIIAHDLARTHVSYYRLYNDDAKRTKGMYRQRIQKAWGHTAHRASSSTAPGTSSSTTRCTAAPTARRCRRTRTIRAATSSLTTPRGGATPLPKHAQPLLLLFRTSPLTEGGAKNEGFDSARTMWTVKHGALQAPTRHDMSYLLRHEHMLSPFIAYKSSWYNLLGSLRTLPCP